MKLATHMLLAAAGSGVPLSLLPLAWWDFADTATISDTAGAVNTVTDKSGNGRTLTGSGLKPITNSTTINGLNVITWAATGADALLSPSLTIAQPVYAFMVVKRLGTDTANRNILGWNANSPTLYVNGNKWGMYVSAAVGSTTACDTNAHVLTGIFDGASSSLRLDGTQIASGNPGTAGWVSKTIPVGADGASSGEFNGIVAELLICPTLTAGQRDAAEAYLKAKWGTP